MRICGRRNDLSILAERKEPGYAGEKISVRSTLVQEVLQQLMFADCRTDATVILHSKFTINPCLQTASQARPLGELSAALLQGHWLEALAACHKVLRPGRDLVEGTLRARITELRKWIEQELLVSSTLDLVDGARRIHLLARRSVLIGRPGGEREPEIAIDCRWLSRGERNLSLSCPESQWLLEDLGSTNGSFVDGSRLVPGAPLPLPVGTTQMRIGRADDLAAPVAFEFRRPVRDPAAVVIRVQHSGSALGTADAWPTVHQDLSRRWIVFATHIGLSAEEDCALRLETPERGIVACIRYQNGFWAIPSAGAKLAINETEFEAPVPIPSGAVIRFGTAVFRAHASTDQEEV